MTLNTASISWTVVHTCTDGAVRDTLVWDNLAHAGRYPWLRCYVCGYSTRLEFRHPDGKVTRDFDTTADFPGRVSPGSSGGDRVSSDL